MSADPRNLLEAFAVLRPDMSVQPVDVSPTLYTELNERFDGFTNHALIAVHDFAESWGTWERHPHGDEVVVLLRGSARMILRTAEFSESVQLGSVGDYVIVPRAIWHTVLVDEPTQMLFITPGEGTEHAGIDDIEARLRAQAAESAG